MNKLLLLLCGSLLVLAPSETALADTASSTSTAETELAADGSIPRPRYKRYRGNSRRSYRRNIFRRMRAKKARKKPAPRRGVITVEPPVRNN